MNLLILLLFPLMPLVAYADYALPFGTGATYDLYWWDAGGSKPSSPQYVDLPDTDFDFESVVPLGDDILYQFVQKWPVVQTTVITYPAGDQNHDWCVDNTDYNLFFTAYSACINSGDYGYDQYGNTVCNNYDPIGDVDRNGIFNYQIDFALLNSAMQQPQHENCEQ